MKNIIIIFIIPFMILSGSANAGAWDKFKNGVKKTAGAVNPVKKVKKIYSGAKDITKGNFKSGGKKIISSTPGASLVKDQYNNSKNIVSGAKDIAKGNFKSGGKKIINVPLKNIESIQKSQKESLPFIPTLPLVDYDIDSLSKLAKDPKDVIGAPFAALVLEGWQSAMGAGVKPMPKEVRNQLDGFFDKRLLDSARYRVGGNLLSGLPAFFTFHAAKGRNAITFKNIAIFKNKTLSKNPVIWAHELYHMKQYRDLGLYKFSSMYTRNSSSIENDAYYFDECIMHILSHGTEGFCKNNILSNNSGVRNAYYSINQPQQSIRSLAPIHKITISESHQHIDLNKNPLVNKVVNNQKIPNITKHTHGGREHDHPLPAEGFNHRHTGVKDFGKPIH